MTHCLLAAYVLAAPFTAGAAVGLVAGLAAGLLMIPVAYALLGGLVVVLDEGRTR